MTFSSIAELVRLIDTLGPDLISFLQTQAITVPNYKKSGLDVEDLVAPLVKQFLEQHGLTEENNVSIQLPLEDNKNIYPDLELRWSDFKLAIDIKAAAGNSAPGNDLGTLRDLASRLESFTAEWLVFIRYDKGSTKFSVFFDRFYRIVGEARTKGVLKYRKKDGNLRPKAWALFERHESHWETHDEFTVAAKRAIEHRAKSIIRERLPELTKEDLVEILKDEIGKLDDETRNQLFQGSGEG